MEPIVCGVCSTVYTHRRQSLDRGLQEAADHGWQVGLPHNENRCPEHHRNRKWWIGNSDTDPLEGEAVNDTAERSEGSRGSP